MQIANPIYDVVFKYLMEDSQSAKILLSTLTGWEILTIDPLPQEMVLSTEKEDKEEESPKSTLELSVYRLDFSARIKEASGKERLIIIEVQKSKFVYENVRFRKYLGSQYSNGHLSQWLVDEAGRSYHSGIPILAVYFIGEPMKGFEGIPVIRIEKTLKDRHTNKTLDKTNPFIEALFHEGIIIHIPALSQRRRDELEILLSIFDQSNRAENHHIMNVRETDFPERFRPLVRRLQAAAKERELRRVMTVEDDFLSEIMTIQDKILLEARLKEEERRQKEEERRQKEEERRQKEEERRLKEEALRKQEEAIVLLIKSGIELQGIATSLNISISELEEIQKRMKDL